MPYSSPTIILPPSEGDGGEGKAKPIMHSLAIVHALEDLQPSPPLRLDTALHLEAEKVVESVALVIWWDGMVAMQDACLSERSRAYFARTRKEVFGASLEELRDVKGGEVAWGEAGKEGGVLAGMGAFLTRHKEDGELLLWRNCGVTFADGVNSAEGPFVLGSRVSYADFVVVALLECLKRVDRPGWERLMRFDPSFKELHEACEEWLKRDD